MSSDLLQHVSPTCLGQCPFFCLVEILSMVYVGLLIIMHDISNFIAIALKPWENDMASEDYYTIKFSLNLHMNKQGIQYI